MKDISIILKDVCSVPCIYSGKVLDGYENSQPSRCKSCEHLACTKKNAGDSIHNICPEKFSYYVTEWCGESLIFNGLIVEDKNHKISGPRRKDLRRLWVKHSFVLDLIARLKRLELAFESELREAAKETISFLHDVRSSAGLVLHNCEEIVSRLPGKDFSEKMTNLRKEDSKIFTLYQSINFLIEQLGLADVISNPESITYGRKSNSSIRPFIYKMAKLFEAGANARHLFISVEGDTNVHVSTYQSFQLVPLIILDNAIKYGRTGTNVIIKFHQDDSALQIEFISYGDVVPVHESTKIFQRHIRGSNAEMRHPHGTGLGLFLAKQIVDAHGYELLYKGDEVSQVNSFTLSIPKSEWAQ